MILIKVIDFSVISFVVVIGGFIGLVVVGVFWWNKKC